MSLTSSVLGPLSRVREVSSTLKSATSSLVLTYQLRLRLESSLEKQVFGVVTDFN